VAADWEGAAAVVCCGCGPARVAHAASCWFRDDALNAEATESTRAGATRLSRGLMSRFWPRQVGRIPLVPLLYSPQLTTLSVSPFRKWRQREGGGFVHVGLLAGWRFGWLQRVKRRRSRVVRASLALTAMKALDGAAHAHHSPEAARQTTSHRIPSAPVRSAGNGGSAGIGCRGTQAGTQVSAVVRRAASARVVSD
jgi:hypothetical protein